MTMRTASILSKGRSAAEDLRSNDSGLQSSPTGVNGVCQRRNTAFPRLVATPLTNLPVAASSGAVTGLFARPISHGQFRLLPVPMPRDEPEAEAWGERIAAWVRA